MPGYQPPLNVHPVWWTGTNVNTFDPGTNVGIQLQSIFGWDDRVEVRDVREARHSQDGEHADNVFLGGRTITLEGIVFGSTWANLQTRKRALAALFTPQSDESLFKVPVPDAAAPTAVYAETGMVDYERVNARVVESIVFGDLHGPAAQAFQVILRASDPRVYSDVETTSSSTTSGTASRAVTIDQAGTYETPTLISLTGPTAATWSLSEPLGGLTVASSSLAMTTGEILDIDVLQRTVDFTASYGGVRRARGDVIAQWLLNETSGTTADNAQGTATYDGTYAGAYTLNQTGHASGIVAVDLTGGVGGGYITIPYNAALNASAMSVEGWFNTDVIPSGRYVIDNYSGTGGWYLKLNSTTHKLQLASRFPAGLAITAPGSGPTIVAGTWYHFAVVRNATSVELFINGAYVDGMYSGASTGGNPIVNSTVSFEIGRSRGGSGTETWNGRLDSFTMYAATLSAAEVAQLYAASTASATLPGYRYLEASSTRWANLQPASSTFTLESSGLNTGSQLSVRHRGARL